MRRRDFFKVTGGAAVSWPLIAGAQQPARIRQIGVLSAGPESDSALMARINAFRQEFQKFGWAEGRNVRLDYRFASGNPDLLRSYAAELVAMTPDVILSVGTTSLTALQQATRTVPIVFAQVSDPVELGFVASVSRPGGNITGFALYETSIAVKWVELLKELAPNVKRVAFLFDPVNPAMPGYLSAMEASASTQSVQVRGATVRSVEEITTMIGAFAREPNGGLVVGASTANATYRDHIIALAARHKVPAVYFYRYYVTEGGLASYGVDLNERYRRAASYVDRILKGEKPGDLPVQFPTKYELVINLKTAKALGLDLPVFLRARTDEVIE